MVFGGSMNIALTVFDGLFTTTHFFYEFCVKKINKYVVRFTKMSLSLHHKGKIISHIGLFLLSDCPRVRATALNN